MDRNMSFYLLTDCHYLSKECWDEGLPITKRERGDQIALKTSPQILDTFLEKIIADKTTDTVIFLGDNVNSGDMNSHREFRNRLQMLKDAGKNVYISVATHDYCSPNGEDECFQKNAVRYTAAGCEPVPFMLRSELFDFYEPFTHRNALSVDPESGSYVVKIGDKLRMIIIIDNGNGRSHCGLFEEGMKWLESEVDRAAEAGDYVLFAVHHPVIPPWEVYRHMADFELYGGYRELSALMCKKKVRAVFTGHTHVQNIRRFEGENGRYFFDISTVALVNAGGVMRKVTITGDGKCTVESVGIDKINGVDTGEKTRFDYLYELNFTGLIEHALPYVKSDYDGFLTMTDGLVPVDKLKKHKMLVKFAVSKVEKLKMSSLAKLVNAKKLLTKEQYKNAENQKALESAFVLLRHIYTGNAPFTPGTVENTVFTCAAKRLDRLTNIFNIKPLKNLIPSGSSFAQMAQDFLYNNRTGDDDFIEFNLN
ncbi:MAG: metallophosphoesterase [Clostridiales bacterium]|nr:metallophosphoesterase [Clostridiales bacterium]